jgi:hypothetical protein
MSVDDLDHHEHDRIGVKMYLVDQGEYLSYKAME